MPPRDSLPGARIVNILAKIKAKEVSFVQLKKVTKVLLFSDDLKSVHTLRDGIKYEGEKNHKIVIYNCSNLNKVLLITEECVFDVIIIDYSTSNRNTLHFLEYLSIMNKPTKNCQKIVLTEDFDHIEETARADLLQFANRVISKTASYFNLCSTIREVLVLKLH